MAGGWRQFVDQRGTEAPASPSSFRRCVRRHDAEHVRDAGSLFQQRLAQSPIKFAAVKMGVPLFTGFHRMTLDRPHNSQLAVQVSLVRQPLDRAPNPIATAQLTAREPIGGGMIELHRMHPFPDAASFWRSATRGSRPQISPHNL